ncbi:MAG: alpha/beta hydrolase [Phycisphaeraceae bacterium]|nr:alpha/beta hydrolase [Phycisphaeraceae bacterium]
MAQHWIVTNRRVETDPKSGRERVVVTDSQSERLDSLPTFRIASFKATGLPATPSAADLEGAVTFLKDTFEPGYDDVTKATKAETLPGTQRMFKSLYDTMSAAPEGKGDVLFFIHGFNYSWPDALVHLHRLTQVYASNAHSPVSQIIYYTWPSWGKIHRYWKDQEIAAPAGMVMGRLFSKLVRFYAEFFDPERRRARPELCGKRIHLAAHSMGNQVLREFMRSIVGDQLLRHPVFGETLLLNADVEWTALNPGEPMHELATYSDRVHVYNHVSDDALRHSSTVKNPGEKRLGQHGPQSVDTNILPARTVAVDCSALRLGAKSTHPAASGVPMRTNAASVLGAISDKASIEAAARVLEQPKGSMKERLFDHWGYLHRPEVIADIWQVMSGASSSRIMGRERRSNEHLYRLVNQ